MRNLVSVLPLRRSDFQMEQYTGNLKLSYRAPMTGLYVLSKFRTVRPRNSESTREKWPLKKIGVVLASIFGPNSHLRRPCFDTEQQFRNPQCMLAASPNLLRFGLSNCENN